MKNEIGQTTVFFVGETPSNSINSDSFVGSFCCFRGNYFWKVWDGAGRLMNVLGKWFETTLMRPKQSCQHLISFVPRY